MNKRQFLGAAAAGALPLAGRAQQPSLAGRSSRRWRLAAALPC